MGREIFFRGIIIKIKVLPLQPLIEFFLALQDIFAEDIYLRYLKKLFRYLGLQLLLIIIEISLQRFKGNGQNSGKIVELDVVFIKKIIGILRYKMVFNEINNIYIVLDIFHFRFRHI